MAYNWPKTATGTAMLEQLEDWLTATIPGIITLGAAGSLLALFVVWLVKRFLPPMVKRALGAFLTVAANLLAIGVAKRNLRLYLIDNSNKFIAYYAMLVTKTVLGLAGATWLLIILLPQLERHSEDLASAAVLVPAIGLFVCLIWGLKAASEVWVTSVVDFQKLCEERFKDLRESAEKLEKERLANNDEAN